MLGPQEERAPSGPVRDSSSLIGRTFKLRDKLLSSWQPDVFVGPALSIAEVRELAAALLELLPRGVSAEALLTTLSPLSGQPLSEEDLKKLLWRLAGNVPRLKAGLALPPPGQVSEWEWVPLQFVDGKELRLKTGRTGIELTWRALAGALCGELGRCVCSSKFCFAAATHLGLARYGPGRLTSPRELVMLRVAGLFDPLKSAGRGPRFEKIKAGPAMADYNRQLHRRRRRELAKCPKGFSHECYRCHVGYGDCPMGVHPRTFSKSLCEGCGKEAWHDPAEEACVECLLAERLKRKE